MTNLATWIFYISVFLVLYTLLIYPLGMALIGLLFGIRPKEPIMEESDYPSIAIIVAACNEVEFIEEGLESLHSAEYPAGKKEIIVVTDDGSVDGTLDLVSNIAKSGTIRHLHCPHPGKNVCLDFAIERTSADILVFKDATGIFAEDTLLRLTSHFSQSEIGCVGGSVIFKDNKKIGAKEKPYWVIENLIRRGNLYLGYLPSAAGGIHALRRELYRPVVNDITRDMVDPVQAITQGQGAIFDDQAICFEIPWGGTVDVFKNRLRTTQRAWSAIRYNASELWKAKRYLILWQMFSHKVLRFLVAFPLFVILLSSLVLAPSSKLFVTLTSVQLAFYALSLATIFAASKGLVIPIFSFVGFVLVNLVSMAVATIRYWTGARANFWKHHAEGDKV